MTYSGKDKYESRYTIKKKPSRYKREQQGHQIAQERVIDKKSNHRSRSDSNLRKSSGRRNYFTKRN